MSDSEESVLPVLTLLSLSMPLEVTNMGNEISKARRFNFVGTLADGRRLAIGRERFLCANDSEVVDIALQLLEHVNEMGVLIPIEIDIARKNRARKNEREP